MKVPHMYNTQYMLYAIIYFSVALCMWFIKIPFIHSQIRIQIGTRFK